MTRFSALRERLSTSLWFIPSLFAVAALVGALLLIELDRALQVNGSAFFIYGGTPEGARSILSTIAQSMLTFTALVFTVTMLVLQLASSQLSPRVLRTFLADRQNQVVLGLFVATFIFTLVVLRDVRSTEGSEFVPAISVWMAFVLLGASLVAFIYYINHMAHAIRASSVIANIAADTRSAIDRVYPDDFDGQQSDPSERNVSVLRERRDWRSIESDQPGYVLDVDKGAIVERATSVDAVVELVPQVGDFVARGAQLFKISSSSALAGREARGEFESGLRQAVSLGPERTMQQDPAFGFRQLVDVAARALSPGTNDPTTCVEAVDRLHDLLLQLVTRNIPPSTIADGEGVPRLLLKYRPWDEFVRLAVDELGVYGERHIRVIRRLETMLESVAENCREERLPIVRLELTRVRRQRVSLENELGDVGAQLR